MATKPKIVRAYAPYYSRKKKTITPLKALSWRV
jgi:hypothetical protein